MLAASIPHLISSDGSFHDAHIRRLGLKPQTERETLLIVTCWGSRLVKYGDKSGGEIRQPLSVCFVSHRYLWIGSVDWLEITIQAHLV